MAPGTSGDAAGLCRCLFYHVLYCGMYVRTCIPCCREGAVCVLCVCCVYVHRVDDDAFHPGLLDGSDLFSRLCPFRDAERHTTTVQRLPNGAKQCHGMPQCGKGGRRQLLVLGHHKTPTRHRGGNRIRSARAWRRGEWLCQALAGLVKD